MIRAIDPINASATTPAALATVLLIPEPKHDGGLRIAAEALCVIGYRKNQVQRALKKFRKQDEKHIKELVNSRHEQKAFIKHGRQIIEDLEKMMLEDIENEAKDKDLGWDTESIIEEFAPIMIKLQEQENKK